MPLARSWLIGNTYGQDVNQMEKKMSMTEREDRQVARPLHVLVPLIREDLAQADEAADRAAEPFKIAAAIKFVEARRQMNFSEYASWANRNFGLRETQAKEYLSIGKYRENNAGAPPITSQRQFQREILGRDKPNPVKPQAWHEPVKEVLGRVDAETLSRRREDLNRAEERDVERKLALQLIDIGYKALATKLHPDKGGSRDAMSRLNRVRDRLKSHV